jgi:hypothetical protein
MAKKEKIDQRFKVRHPLLGDLSGKILLSTGKTCRCLALDVSDSGLKLMSFEQLTVGAELILRVDNNDTALKVVWVSERQGDIDHYVCGVTLSNRSEQEQGLESLFSKKNWLDRKSS